MDSTILVKELLSVDAIEQGALLIEHLEHAGLSVKAALWHYETELNVWKLVLAMDEVDEIDTRKIYKIIDKARHDVGLVDLGMNLWDFKVTSPKQQWIRALRKDLKTGAQLNRTRIKRSFIGGKFIEDALIYKL